MKKIILSFILFHISFAVALADGVISGILVTFDGSETCYKLDDMPTVTTIKENGVQKAVLTLKDSSEPVVTIELTNGAELLVTWGEYTPSGIDEVSSDKVIVTERNGRKYISGGRLIIVDRSGKCYDINGREIKN